MPLVARLPRYPLLYLITKPFVLTPVNGSFSAFWRKQNMLDPVKFRFLALSVRSSSRCSCGTPQTKTAASVPISFFVASISIADFLPGVVVALGAH